MVWVRIFVIIGACAVTAGFAQALRLTGRVLEKAGRQPVPGALVKLEGASAATLSGPDGRFVLTETSTTVLDRSSGYGAGRPLLRNGGIAFSAAPAAAFPIDFLDLSGRRLASVTARSRVGALSRAALAKSGAADVRVTMAGLQPKTVSAAGNTADLGDIVLDYPPRRLDTGSAPIYGSRVLFSGEGDSLDMRRELEEKWEHWVSPQRIKRNLGKTPILWKLMPDPKSPSDKKKWTLMTCCKNDLPGGAVFGYDDLITKAVYRDFQLHIEFNLMGAYDATNNPSGYANSGIYLQNKYELQVQSYPVGQIGDGHDMAAFLWDAIPKVAAQREQGEWQAHDITFRMARFDANGRVTQPALATCYFNGKLIHDNVKLTVVSGGDDGGTPVRNLAEGLKLQVEGTDVRYRNIWIKELVIDQAQTNFGY